MTAGAPARRRRLTLFLAIAFGWTWLLGLALGVLGVPLDSLPATIVLAALYMPAPFVAAVIAERGLRRDRLRLPRGRAAIRFLALPSGAAVGVMLLMLALVFAGGTVLTLPGFGTLATTTEAVEEGAAALFGAQAVAAAGTPPPPLVLLAAGVWGALVAGWTINGLLALGEEYGWRGLLWEELRPLGTVRANVILGVVWGLWHAPLIVQGFNYPGEPLWGVAMMVVFAVPMSFVLTALRELTGSVLPVAAAHGIVNALAPLVLLLVPGAAALVAGPVGAAMAVSAALVAAVLWLLVARRTARPVASGAPSQAVHR